jgi:hypothetical protein
MSETNPSKWEDIFDKNLNKVLNDPDATVEDLIEVAFINGIFRSDRA